MDNEDCDETQNIFSLIIPFVVGFSIPLCCFISKGASMFRRCCCKDKFKLRRKERSDIEQKYDKKMLRRGIAIGVPCYSDQPILMAQINDEHHQRELCD